MLTVLQDIRLEFDWRMDETSPITQLMDRAGIS